MEKPSFPEPAQPLQGAEPGSLAKAAGAAGDEEARAASSKLTQCACLRRWLPLAYREELYHVLRLTGPLVLSRILNFLLPFVVTIFCGHIGNEELAGYALASATINVTTTATGYGLAVACDTLISQTFGSKNLKRVGVILQRSSLILLLVCLPCWAVLINAQNLLLLMGQNDEVARIAHLYVMTFLPAVPAMFLHQLQVAYLQNQGIILPQMYTAAAANIINVGVNYALITHFQLGVIGSAIASSLSQITICLLLFIYIRCMKLHKQTWDGWSTECLQEWGSYMKLAVPSLFMVWFEWWIWEIGSFLAGILGAEDLAAQHILVEIGSIGYMFPLGIQAAACVRVGNALGAGNTNRAKITCKVALVLAGLLAVIQAIVIASSRSILGLIFTSDGNILRIVSENLKVYLFLQFFDALLCVSSGILVGAGMQKIAAFSNLVCYYCISLPVGMALMFTAKLRLIGLWLGIFMCVFFETGFFIGLIFKLNWKKVTVKAQRRAGKKNLITQTRPTSLLLNEAVMPSINEDKAQLSSEGASTTDGYSPVAKELKAVYETEAGGADAGGARDGDAEQSAKTPNKKPKAPHSVKPRSTFNLTWANDSTPDSRSTFNLTWANDSTPTTFALFNLTSTVSSLV
ncbi:multidrug and toxin extrusion protein 1 [Salarias fasciatus]|uniref:multidrug and toxin extrusion protein 1 n=1 Tax=Salarias fasciatus TaxID=181472 RepID=UPI0011768257|nr:multidrug and toxin extrusion protein 1-like [Salarias fasciatus]